MQVLSLAIPDVKIITPRRIGDHRGFFSEIYSRSKFADAGISADFVQDNHSLSAEKGVVRGLHYQIEPMAQGKLVRVIRGSILDVAVDIRVGSVTFGQHVTQVVSAENWVQIWVPVGFAHGFVTLEPATEVVYKVTANYSPQHERGILWNDPALKINWGIGSEGAILSPRDREHPVLSAACDLFHPLPTSATAQ